MLSGRYGAPMSRYKHSTREQSQIQHYEAETNTAPGSRDKYSTMEKIHIQHQEAETNSALGS